MVVATITTPTLLFAVVIELFQLTYMFQDVLQVRKLLSMAVSYYSKRSNAMLKAILKFILCLLSLNAFASDHEKALTIEANVMEMNLTDKTAIFSGAANIKSDVFDVRADVVEVRLSVAESSVMKEKIRAVKAYMKEKRFMTTTIKGHNARYNIECTQIDIDVMNNNVVLSDATFSDGKSTVVGDKIIYDLKSEKITVTGKQNKKVKVTIKNDS